MKKYYTQGPAFRPTQMRSALRRKNEDELSAPTEFILFSTLQKKNKSVD